MIFNWFENRQFLLLKLAGSLGLYYVFVKSLKHSATILLKLNRGTKE